MIFKITCSCGCKVDDSWIVQYCVSPKVMLVVCVTHLWRTMMRRRVCGQKMFLRKAEDRSERLHLKCISLDHKLLLLLAQFKLIFLSLSGHGDQRHAVHRDWVCKERRNVWWVWCSPRYSDSCTQHLMALWPRRLLSPQTSWHHTVAWAKMRPGRSSGRSWQP